MTSLLLADIPYKTVFFQLDSLTVGFIYVFIKFSYKLFKEPVAVAYSQSICVLIRKISKAGPSENPEAVYYVMGFKGG
jgi:hypothetical protein